MLCMECGSEMRECHDPIDTEFRGEMLTVHGIDHHLCDACGEIVFDAKDGKKYDAEVIRQYATLHGFLSPDEIREIRRKSGLSQRDFEKVLGVSSPSVSRWETGHVLQSKPVDLLMKAYRDRRELMRARIEQCEIHTSNQGARVVIFPKGASGKQGNRVKQAEESVMNMTSHRVEPALEM